MMAVEFVALESVLVSLGPSSFCSIHFILPIIDTIKYIPIADNVNTFYYLLCKSIDIYSMIYYYRVSVIEGIK